MVKAEEIIKCNLFVCTLSSINTDLNLFTDSFFFKLVSKQYFVYIICYLPFLGLSKILYVKKHKKLRFKTYFPKYLQLFIFNVALVIIIDIVQNVRNGHPVAVEAVFELELEL